MLCSLAQLHVPRILCCSAADATITLPAALKVKQHKPKPDMPPDYQLERPINNSMGPDQVNPIVFYDIWYAQSAWCDDPLIPSEKTDITYLILFPGWLVILLAASFGGTTLMFMVGTLAKQL
jgi:hypothetical protein